MGSVIAELLANKDTLSQSLLEGRVLGGWNEVVGVFLADATQKITFRDGVLLVTFNSSAAASSFFANRTEIRDKLNAIAGKTIVKFIQVAIG